ncbi:MAG TPA: zinc metallopeptidase [Solirubrobacteraceae bacterium]|jgi:Zn-dependent membrane protease YugP|nr:zinc metallopeptidase [Solirubrobacteraceae bacterium]
MSLTGIFLICTVIPLLFGLWAQFKVKSTFKRYSQVPVTSGLTGAQAAEAVLRNSDVHGVGIRPVAGELSDHYDPRSKTLNLSQDVGGAATVAALGVAAHEAGHAVQDARNYTPMRIRSTLVPAASIGSQVWIFPAIIGLILGSTGLVNIGLVLFLAVVIFQLVTLPVEFDASHRAIVALEGGSLLTDTELSGARKVLQAAALTYVAALVASIGQLIYFFLASRR